LPFPDPKPGLVISYEYVWRDEHRQGVEQGRKARPCIIAGVREDDLGKVRVSVWPITHSPQDEADNAIELPPRVADYLSLDDDPQYIVTNEVNEFSWPGPDLQPTRNDEYDYGEIPGALFRQVQERFVEHARRGSVSKIPREFDARAEMERLKEEQNRKK
jgi:hypothetical protein